MAGGSECRTPSSLSLPQILQDEENKNIRSAFLRHCKKQRCEESALFLMAVDRWKKLYERDFHDKEVTIASQFNDIIEEFIQEHAPNQVNITYSVREALLAAAAQDNEMPSRRVFDQCERSLYLLLNNGPYVTFLSEGFSSSIDSSNDRIANSPSMSSMGPSSTSALNSPTASRRTGWLTVGSVMLRSHSLDALSDAVSHSHGLEHLQAEVRSRTAQIWSRISPRSTRRAAPERAEREFSVSAPGDIYARSPISMSARSSVGPLEVPRSSVQGSLASTASTSAAAPEPTAPSWKSPRLAHIARHIQQLIVHDSDSLATQQPQAGSGSAHSPR